MTGLRTDRPERWNADALAEPRCLACHTNPALAAAADRERARHEGVSCEACHGNAGGWHLEHAGWTAAERATRYDSLGMVKLYDLGVRAAACAGCHAGAPADPARGYPLRDVNHEMIAAGHPRLNFELADYQRRLPPHWMEKDRTGDPAAGRGAEFEAKVWLVGRVASAEAACRLLADRAARADRDESADWPELGESNCFACHRELPRQPRRPAGRARSAEWQTIWPLTRPEHISSRPGLSGPKWQEAGAEVTAIRKEFARREPRAAEAARHAARAAVVLRELRSQIAATPDRAAAKAVLDLYSHVDPESLDWDEACQVTHGLAALEWVRLRRTPPDRRVVNPMFDNVFTGLTFPRPDGKDHFDSPRKFDPTAAKANLSRLIESVRSSCSAVLD